MAYNAPSGFRPATDEASREAMVKGSFFSMNFANSDLMDRPAEAVRDNMARAEKYLKPRMGLDLLGRAKACVGNFPMAAVLTAFAGGVLVGVAAMSRRQELHDLILRDLSEPIQRGRQMLATTMEAAGQALSDGSDSMRSMARRDLDLLRKEASRWQSKMHL
jgi:hypothetical protein